jgi:carbamoyl-phosphate synthase small subunit
MSAVRLPARLALEDGWTALGMAVGAAGTATGECVFNTCLSGYEEVLTDPSYTGQLVVMTYPLIGNYGITIEDGESDGPQVAGFVMRECVQEPSSWRAVETLPVHLERNGVVAIEGIDTRALCGNGVRCEGSSRPSCWRSSRRWPERRRSRRWRGRI